MLDHVFTDAIGALREALENALLERQAFEERFQTDILLGDTTWETTYGLPGEGQPPRVRADISLLWPTWSQTAYRNWYIGEAIDDPPRIDIEVVLRIQRLAEPADAEQLLAVLPEVSPVVGGDSLTRIGHTLETIFQSDEKDPEYAIEVSYEGTYELGEAGLSDGTALDKDFSAMGGWISSTLVRVGDLNFNYRPADITDD